MGTGTEGIKGRSLVSVFTETEGAGAGAVAAVVRDAEMEAWRRV